MILNSEFVYKSSSLINLPFYFPSLFETTLYSAACWFCCCWVRWCQCHRVEGYRCGLTVHSIRRYRSVHLRYRDFVVPAYGAPQQKEHFFIHGSCVELQYPCLCAWYFSPIIHEIKWIINIFPVIWKPHRFNM